MRLGPKPNWAEVEHFIVESYRKIAPKKLVKELDALDGKKGPADAAKPARTSKAAPKKTVARKVPAPKKPAVKSAVKKPQRARSSS